jgi:hypothetical protein
VGRPVWASEVQPEPKITAKQIRGAVVRFIRNEQGFIEGVTVVGFNCSKDVLGEQPAKGRAGDVPTIFADMREIAHIPHPLMRITVHSYNGNYRLRFELDRFEQSFKFPEADHALIEVETLGKVLSEGVLMRFVDMRNQLHTETIKS